MKKLLFVFLFFVLCKAYGKTESVPDTVSVGIYINSVHDIDFKEKQYNISLWLWLKYKNHDFDFSKYLEIPMAKTVDKSFYTVDTLSDGRIYMLMKLQCTMKDNWKIQKFPFDRQKLRFSVENSQYDSGDLIFVADTAGKHYSKWIINGWKIIADSFNITTSIKKYETVFGDPSAIKPYSEFSNYKVLIGLERDSWGLFMKLFTGMYISFLLSFLCFFIHSDSVESRFSLSVGSLFAVIGNKYIVDASLPESTSFTLVDSLHGITLFFIFAIVACSAYALKLTKRGDTYRTRSFDKRAGIVVLAAYIVVNVWLIYCANN